MHSPSDIFCCILSHNFNKKNKPKDYKKCLACTSDKLKQNNPSFVELSLESLGDKFGINEFVYTMSCNYTVTHVRFSGTFVPELSYEQWDCKSVLSLSSLQSLEELQILCSTISISILANVICQSKKIFKICII